MKVSARRRAVRTPEDKGGLRGWPAGPVPRRNRKGLHRPTGPGEPHREGCGRLLQGKTGGLQGAQADRVHGRTPEERDRQGTEERAKGDGREAGSYMTLQG